MGASFKAITSPLDVWCGNHPLVNLDGDDPQYFCGCDEYRGCLCLECTALGYLSGSKS